MWPQFSESAQHPWSAILPPSTNGDSPDADSERPPSTSHFPLPGWPDRETVEYLTKLIVLGLLLIGLPFIIGHVLTKPGDLMKGRVVPVPVPA